MHDIDHGGVLERFEHDGLIYRGEDDFLAATVPFVEAGLEAGEPVLVAVPAGRLAALRGAIDLAGEQVSLADVEQLAANPARIVSTWAEFVQQHPGPARGVGETVWPHRPADAVAECVHHEALLNLALADAAGFRLLCPYDATVLSDAVLDGVLRTHRHLRADGVRAHSPRIPPHAPVPLVPPAPLSDAPDGVPAWPFGPSELRAVRARVRAVGVAAGLRTNIVDDLALAAHEIAANSVEHGGGRGSLRTWRSDWSLVVEVTDGGHIADPLIGRLAPPPELVGGRGLWMAQQLCDLLQLRTSPSGTTVRLHARTA